MPVANAAIVQKLDELADLLEIEGANPFRVRAYRNAARTVEASSSIVEMVEQGEDLAGLPGIGRDLAGKITQIARTGDLGFLHEVEARVPTGLRVLLHVPGLGPKRVKMLHEALGVEDVASLRGALEGGKIGKLKGFGPKSEQKIRDALTRHLGETRRFLLHEIEETAQAFLAYVRAQPGVARAEIAGSYRRRKETVGDLDLVVGTRNASALMDALARHEEVAEVVAKGGTRSTVRLASRLEVDLRAVPPHSYGAALHYFTGSKAHNIAIRRRGIDRGLKVNEYGVFRGRTRIAGRTEREVYRAVGLPPIPPELRENRGEIEAAQKGKLPRLVEERQIRGDLQTHTRASDGRSTLEAMVEAARGRGYDYVAVTDHSRRVTMANGLDPRRVRAQCRRIEKLNDGLDDITVLKGIEVDILKDGRLDLPDATLRALDVVVCSIHYHMDLPQAVQTRRVLRAMENPHAHILGHPTGRLLGQREGYGLDFERVFDAAHEQGWFVELNAQPTRLDLPHVLARQAKEHGVGVSIGTDAHHASQLRWMRFGVDQARRAWLERADVVNTRPLGRLRKLLDRG